MKIAHELRDGTFDAEELVGKEVINLHRLVFVQPLGARIVGLLNIVQAARNDQVVDARMRKLGERRIGLYDFWVFEKRSTPLLRFTRGPVLLDHALEIIDCGHQQTPCLRRQLLEFLEDEKTERTILWLRRILYESA